MSTSAPAEASRTPARRDRLARFRGWTRGVLIANVIAQIGIIVTGGAVRLTGSGLGCSTWPQCEPGSFTPVFHAEVGIHPYIEFGNRLLTFVLAAIAVLVLLLVLTDRRRSRAYRWLGVVPLAGVVAQAVIGGVVVLLDLHPAWVSLHFVVSAALVWLAAYLLHRHCEGDGAPTPVGPRTVTLAGRALALLVVPVVLLGVAVTAAGPHSGDAEVGYRLAVDPLLMTRAHSASVWLFVGVLTVLLVLLHRTPDAAEDPLVRRARAGAWLLLAVTLAQGAVGYVQYFTGLPEILVALHMLGAGLLVWATANAVLRLRTRA
ncbi:MULTISPECIES: heme A synthase [unclassified Isoptericola]|uniref:COX15/CtaA family protein n=1 Tax=unclassified Isoptericola TaxID=2623355 RepID=UPI002712D197|nr:MULTISPECIES: COX15/CtaA family protein [unclassified Isoptericola]MDO8149514.1 COX15/CtaA family protein [Isoptericola sp. b515]MDO8152448.1 COX15/CtaA family protein [Isoptericola sp. b408]